MKSRFIVGFSVSHFLPKDTEYLSKETSPLFTNRS